MLVLIVPLVTAPYLARILGAEQLGIFGYVSSVSSIIVTVGTFGIYSYGNREIAYSRDDVVELSKTFYEIMLIRLGLFILTTGLYYLIIINSGYTKYFWIYFFWLIANFIDTSWFFVGLENMRTVVLKNTLIKVVTVIGIFIVVKSQNDLWKYIMLISVSTFLANISIYPLIKNYVIKIKIFPIKKGKLTSHLTGALHLFLPQVATTIYLQADKIMIEYFTGSTHQIAFYQQAEKIINIPLAIITGLSTVMMPRIANEFKKKNSNSINNYIIKAADVSLLLAFPMAIGLGVISRNFIPWYLGNEFVPTITALILMSPLIIINTLTAISGNQFFIQTNQINILLRAYITSVIINIIANIILIPNYGYAGAAIASVFAGFVSVFVQYYFMMKQIKINTIFRQSLIYLFYATLMGIVIVLISINLPNKYWVTLVQISIGFLVYMILLIVNKNLTLKKMFSLLKGFKNY